ncbi:MAG: AbrB/MazE/SpoVT family DNA-binding domain-containing protein [Nocardioides sp.]
MNQSTVTSKGQITIPKAVRDDLGIEAGTQVVFVRTSMGYVLRARNQNLMDLRGVFAYDGPPISEEEAERRWAEALAEKFRP